MIILIDRQLKIQRKSAIKKGYIAFQLDPQDKRRRYLVFTAKGREVLAAFEQIAFLQTKNALLTLKPEEVAQVYQGIALYAGGLKTCREDRMIVDQLKGLGYELTPYQKEDEESLYAIFQEVVDSGKQFPYASNSKEEFHKQFLSSDRHVHVCRGGDGEVVGGFYIRRNEGSTANCAYMIKSSHRGKGIGSLLVKMSFILARELGFTRMQYNRVLSGNPVAIQLYLKLGFRIEETILEGFPNPDGTFQEGYVMVKDLV